MKICAYIYVLPLTSSLPDALLPNGNYIVRLLMFPLWLAVVIILYFLSGYWLWKLINIFYYCDYAKKKQGWRGVTQAKPAVECQGATGETGDVPLDRDSAAKQHRPKRTVWERGHREGCGAASWERQFLPLRLGSHTGTWWLLCWFH